MEKYTSYAAYCWQVCQAMTDADKREKQAAVRDLANHMKDHAAELEAKGYTPQEAMERAIAAMGDPREVGTELNRQLPPKKFNKWCIIGPGILVAVAALLIARNACLFPVPVSRIQLYDIYQTGDTVTFSTLYNLGYSTSISNGEVEEDTFVWSVRQPLLAGPASDTFYYETYRFDMVYINARRQEAGLAPVTKVIFGGITVWTEGMSLPNEPQQESPPQESDGCTIYQLSPESLTSFMLPKE
ncbi:MAG: DNA recombination protein RmuC [Clostridiales bacterium]|nr:DNA recombination protein RmuC [Clostridiales bacterium]